MLRDRRLLFETGLPRVLLVVMTRSDDLLSGDRTITLDLLGFCWQQQPLFGLTADAISQSLILNQNIILIFSCCVREMIGSELGLRRGLWGPQHACFRVLWIGWQTEMSLRYIEDPSTAVIHRSCLQLHHCFTRSSWPLDIEQVMIPRLSRLQPCLVSVGEPCCSCDFLAHIRESGLPAIPTSVYHPWPHICWPKEMLCELGIAITVSNVNLVSLHRLLHQFLDLC